MSGFKVDKIGKWATVIKGVANMSKTIDKGLQKSLKQIGLKGEQIAIKHIQNQDLGWRPLSKAYLKQKKRKGYSEKILVRTSTLLQNIKSEVIKKKGVFVGVNRQAKDAEGNNLSDIAKIMEYGSKSRNIEARPLWQPTQKELEQWIKDEDILIKNVKKEISNIFN